MTILSHFFRQILIASSVLITSVSVGTIVGFPAVLLQQFKANDSAIKLDLNTISWIGSTHGIGGVLSILMPSVMQLKGRKFAFIVSCGILIAGWLLILSARSIYLTILGELVHGFGTNCVCIVSLMALSEMINPRFRMIFMAPYLISEVLGFTLVGFMGKFLHWTTICWVMTIPTLVSLIIGCTWPESPTWLAYKGEYEKCRVSFIWLRGTSEEAQQELNELIHAQTKIAEEKIAQRDKEKSMKKLLSDLIKRDFCLPMLHAFSLLLLCYYSGSLAILTYAADIFRETTGNETIAANGPMYMNIMLLIGGITNVIVLRFFNNRTVMLSSIFACTLFIISASVVTFLQTRGVLEKDSVLLVCLLSGFTGCTTLGVISIIIPMCAELIPVKHKGLGGALYVLFMCISHTTSLKATPYLFSYCGIWGTFLILSFFSLSCFLYVLMFIPETKNKTLIQIQNNYKNREQQSCESHDLIKNVSFA